MGSRAPATALERLALSASLVIAAAGSAAHAENVPDAAHDLGVVRTLGLGWAGAWRGLDVFVAALLGWVPLGTRAFRASLATALVAGLAGALLYLLARRLVAACAPAATRLGPAVAAIASTTTTLSVAWQLEAASPGGSVTGALLTIAPLAIASAAPRVQDMSFGALGFVLGAAVTYEPLVAVAALLSCGAYLALAAQRDAFAWRANARRLAPLLAGLVAALAPAFVWIRGRVDPRLVLPRAPWSAWLGEGGASSRISPVALVHAELGWILVALALAGVAIAFMKVRARPLAAGVLAMALAGYAGVWLGAPAGPSRWGGATLAALGATMVLAAIAMQALVRAVADARIPFARASASMIVVLELAFPARVADDSWTRADERARGGPAAWDEAAWGTVPAGAVVLIQDARALERVCAARATGAMRPDLAIVPTFALSGPMAACEIAREPRVQPFVRDMALEGAPEELSLSSLAAARPLVMSFDPRWEKPLARHLVPAGLLSRFETEPRGASDRRRALDIAGPDRERLERASTAPRDLELCAGAASLLRARVIGFAAAGDRESLARGLDELRPFSPDDRLASELVRRVLTSKGGIDVKDLAP